MDLLDWARGPLLGLALIVFGGGTAWRLLSLRRLPAPAARGHARHEVARPEALQAALRRFVSGRHAPVSATLVNINPYLFHIGLALVFLGYAPHIAFVRRLTGLHWPALPDGVVYLAAAVTIVSLLQALLFRLTDPVLKRISRADDYISWTVTMLPLLTGMAVIDQPSSELARHATVYRTPLAVHLLTLELLLVWFPFGKLMHALLAMPARMQLARFLGRRGVRP